MCRQVTCRECGKPGWAGCGAHVEQVLGHVPRSERCRCAEEKAAKPKQAANVEGKSAESFLSRLFR